MGRNNPVISDQSFSRLLRDGQMRHQCPLMNMDLALANSG
jgi:hypothetical protein